MKKLAIFYGSDYGNTEQAAHHIIEQLGFEADVFDVGMTDIKEMEPFEHILIGVPTWDYGGIQYDWDDQLEKLKNMSFAGKTVACFGLGDQYGYPDYFQDALGILHDIIKANGGKMVGYWPNEGYEFEQSLALSEDQKHFVGLVLDEDNQPELTDQRISTWVAQVKREMGFE